MEIGNEFIRFHPVMKNAADFSDVLYHPILLQNPLGTNLQDYDNLIRAKFSKSCRKNIRQMLKKGLSYNITEASENIDSFIGIYYSTMGRDKASEFYYFGKNYFDAVLGLLRENVLFFEALFEEKTIAVGLYFISDGVIHIHLSGTLSKKLHLSLAYILCYAATLWRKEHGYHLIHHGGGTSNEPDNSLFIFKKQFALSTGFNFYILYILVLVKRHGTRQSIRNHVILLVVLKMFSSLRTER